MSRIPRSLLAAGALVAFAACDDAAAPKGVPGDLTVRAYVDRDASGTFTAGDLAIQGAVVTVTPVDGASTDAREATTDGTGQATFAALEPGRYTLAMGSGVPAGAVLTTNPTPTVAISYQGAVSGQSEFRFSFYPGSISGQIYRDDSGNGQYDAGQDTPGANFLVVLRAASNGTPGAVVDSVRADANGVYSFPRVAAGNYFLEYENPGTITYTGGQSVAITVQPQAPLTPPAPAPPAPTSRSRGSSPSPRGCSPPAPAARTPRSGSRTRRAGSPPTRSRRAPPASRSASA